MHAARPESNILNADAAWHKVLAIPAAVFASSYVKRRRK
jgi:hypothetical protein